MALDPLDLESSGQARQEDMSRTKTKRKGLLGREKKHESGGGGGDFGGETASPDSFKRGGKVRKSGMAKVHKGEVVLTEKQAKRMKKRGGNKRSKGKSR